MNIKNLNQILLLLTYFAVQHDTINAMKRSHDKISDPQQNKQLPPTSKKTKLNNNTAALLCTLCNKTFSTNHNLTTHQRTHTGEKPYKCNICAKRFGTNGNLTIHQRTHTGEKPYSCDICHKSFGTSGNLVVHKKIHTGERPYTCDICHKSFPQKNHLTKHKKTHIKTIPLQINLLNNNTKYIPNK